MGLILAQHKIFREIVITRKFLWSQWKHKKILVAQLCHNENTTTTTKNTTTTMKTQLCHNKSTTTTTKNTTPTMKTQWPQDYHNITTRPQLNTRLPQYYHNITTRPPQNTRLPQDYHKITTTSPQRVISLLLLSLHQLFIGLPLLRIERCNFGFSSWEWTRRKSRRSREIKKNILERARR